MANGNGLIGFAFTAVGCSHDNVGILGADSTQASPEIGADTSVTWILYDLCQLTVLDQATPFATKLKFVTGVID